MQEYYNGNVDVSILSFAHFSNTFLYLCHCCILIERWFLLLDSVPDAQFSSTAPRKPIGPIREKRPQIIFRHFTETGNASKQWHSASFQMFCEVSSYYGRQGPFRHTRWEWVVNTTSRPPLPRERDPVSIVPEAGWSSEPVSTGAENLAPTRIRSPDLPARSESLYRLSYRGSSRCFVRR